MTDLAGNPTREQLRLEGFGLIDERLEYLLGCLKDALESTGEKELLPFMPWSGKEPKGGQMPEGLPQLYSIGFQLLNMVEERVDAEIRRERENAFGADSIRGLWPKALEDLRALGLTPDQILDVLKDVHVEPVLTAHPTEAKRTSVRERHRALYSEMVKNEFPKYTLRERRSIRERVVGTLETLWRTAEIHLVRPDIYSELRSAIHYLRDLFPSTINRLDTHFTEAWRDSGMPLDKLRSAGNIPHLSFGIWIGGDRDGHSLVTPSVTEKTLEELRYEPSSCCSASFALWPPSSPFPATSRQFRKNSRPASMNSLSSLPRKRMPRSIWIAMQKSHGGKWRISWPCACANKRVANPAMFHLRN